MTDWWAEVSDKPKPEEKQDWYGAVTAPVRGQSEMRATPKGARVPWGQNVPVDDPAASAGVGATLEASLHPDVQKQIQVYAKARGIDPKRYGVDKEGNVVFMDPNNNDAITREIPSVSEATGPMDFIKRLGQKVGAEAAPAVPQIAAGTVGTMMGPTAMSVPAAAATAGVVDQGRQVAGNLISGFPAFDTSILDSAEQGLLAALPQSVTAIINKLVTKNALKASPKDLQVLKDPQKYSQYEKTEDLMRDQGITATPAEITGAKSLLNRQRQLGRFDETATTMGDFYKNRNEVQIPRRFGQVMDDISPVTAPAVGARNLQEGAEAAIKAAKDERRIASSPLYQRVVKPDNLIPDDKFAPIAGDEFTASVIKGIKADPLYGMKNLPDNSIVVVDEAHKRLSDMIAEAKRAGATNRVRLLTQKQDALTAVADDAFPDYPAARAAFKGKSPEVDALEDGLVGIVAQDKERGLQNVPKTLFDIKSADPISVATARNAYQKAGKTDEWNAGLRAYLTDTFSAAQKNERVADTFYRQAYADPRQRALLKSAMTPEQYSAFDNFMKSLDVVRKALPEGSPTATDIGGKEAFAGPVARTMGKLPRLLSPQSIGQDLSDFISERSAGKNAEVIANIITKPDSLKELKKLRAMNPTSQKALTIMNDLIAGVTVKATGLALPDERVPEAYGE